MRTIENFANQFFKNLKSDIGMLEAKAVGKIIHNLLLVYGEQVKEQCAQCVIDAGIPYANALANEIRQIKHYEEENKAE